MIKYFAGIIFGVVFVIFLFAGIVHADYYTWEDEQGMMHVTDYPPPSKSVKNIKVHEYEDDQTEVNSEKASQKTQRSSGKDSSAYSVSAENRSASSEVELYVTSWCSYSQKAIEYFRSRNISFREYDIEKDLSAAARKKELAPGSGVPVAVINGDVIRGFSPNSYETSLNKRR